MINKSEYDIMQNWARQYEAPIVTIRCITYNHERFIEKALDSFLMQKTNFPFEIIVHDDASQDSTANIIREYEKRYPTIMKPIYETENQYSKHDGSLTKIVDSAIRGEYIAFCEGDDFWIDEYKLQRQYDFLKKNKMYGFCYTYSKGFEEAKKRFKIGKQGRPFKSYEDLFVNGNKIPTQTIFIKTELYKHYIEDYKPYEKGWLMGDLPMFLWFAKHNEIIFQRKTTAVYRILRESAFHSENKKKIAKFEQSCRDVRLFLAKKYNEPELMKEYDFVMDFKKAYRTKDRQSIIITGKNLPKIARTFKNFIIYIFAHSRFLFYIIKKFI